MKNFNGSLPDMCSNNSAIKTEREGEERVRAYSDGGGREALFGGGVRGGA